MIIRNSLHISLTEFRNESRVIKLVDSLISHGIFNKVYIAALYAEDLASNEIISPNIELKRFSLISRGLNKSLFLQVFKFVEFVVRIFFFYKKYNIGVVNVHSIGLLPLGFLFKLFRGSKLIYDTHELETETNGLRGIRKWVSKSIERLLIRHVDHVFVVSDSIADWYANEYKIERPSVVKNAPRFRLQTKKNLFRESLSILSDQRILLYQGGLMKGRGVQLILDAFKERKDSDVVVVFMGYGELASEVEKAAKHYPNIYYCPAVPPSLLLNYTASADFGIHLIQNTCLNHYFCMPNKFFEYAMAGLPVIVSNMKEMSFSVQAADFGIVLTEYSVDAINAAVDSLAMRDLSNLSNNAYRFAHAHAWEKQEKVMLEGYRRLLKE